MKQKEILSSTQLNEGKTALSNLLIEEMGDQHKASSVDTPMRADAFEKSDEEKINKFNEIFQKMLTLTVAQVARSVAAIKLVDGTLVENPAFISEFFANCDKVIWNTVKDHIQNLNNSNQFKNIDVECSSCKNQFTSPLAFETSNFFG